ncbi:MAG: response regulator [Synechococcus sp. SB0662_bin_45]|nr:response regulator [Synechococcus sp. SB0668_bin_13]MXX09392.1 response regulator [Synechococcus sp. SB0667_bin_8]MYE20873.1 response regulator [Synechococcus sp. SB0662_bin_45]MYG64992.1 response regulator [Synechococcus sp. SB0675_bin_7]MYI71272.1 response regulator [Synechococcus sp. SB0673_bin_10]MYK85220.1 response regulator [Synechococcus sp. SB0669_bin_7]
MESESQPNTSPVAIGVNGWPGPRQPPPADGPPFEEETQGAASTPCKRLLVVDDEPAVRRILETRLRMAGYAVILAADGEEALSRFYREQPDLVVLDVMLPKLDGFGVCRQIRAESTVPVIIVSALDSSSEKVAGLELGADDYLPKPFAPRELEMRIAAVLRRHEAAAAPQPSVQPKARYQTGIIRAGHLVIDTNRRQVTCKGERLGLTYTEFSLLELLFREPGTVVPRATILEELWGYPPRKATNLRVVDVYVARLRNKLEPDPRNPELILTVRGTGYVSQGVTSVSPTDS